MERGGSQHEAQHHLRHGCRPPHARSRRRHSPRPPPSPAGRRRDATPRRAFRDDDVAPFVKAGTTAPGRVRRRARPPPRGDWAPSSARRARALRHTRSWARPRLASNTRRSGSSQYAPPARSSAELQEGDAVLGSVDLRRLDGDRSCSPTPGRSRSGSPGRRRPAAGRGASRRPVDGRRHATPVAGATVAAAGGRRDHRRPMARRGDVLRRPDASAAAAKAGVVRTEAPTSPAGPRRRHARPGSRPPRPPTDAAPRDADRAARQADLRAGPRELRGASSPTRPGVKTVKLRLTKRLGNKCWYFSGRMERFRGTSAAVARTSRSATGPTGRTCCRGAGERALRARRDRDRRRRQPHAAGARDHAGGVHRPMKRARRPRPRLALRRLRLRSRRSSPAGR